MDIFSGYCKNGPIVQRDLQIQHNPHKNLTKRFTEIGKKNYPKIHTEVPKIPNNPEVKELNLYDTSMKQMCRSME